MEQNDRLAQLKSLVSLFSDNLAQYKSGHYDESNTRTDFIDKFFALLDWDVANNQGFSETYRDVVREDKVKIDGSQKAPDYSFRIGGVRKFFVEAKKPSVNIKDAAEPAYQVRRYAYTAKLPLSILTNFEEFAVYDTRIKPGKDDKASTARYFHCSFDQYEKEFDFLYNTFSKNAILKGSFDKYIEENKNKKGTSEVDTELLALVEDWRMVLAKDIARKNPELSIYNLNTVVQRIIDRIVFLRIAEDRGIEDENLLLTVAKTTNIYEKLNLLFTKANVKYNSGLFAYEEWIEKVQIEDKVLSNIIVNLYYPECPYEFSVLPIEILGSIYERFLGKTIHFRTVKGDTHTAIIEEKPEVKKAGGVFYTPQYIVEYIVHNTVGEKIKNKTPEEIANIKICDPACGSGSFLVGAYQYLLNYHLDYYSKDKNVKSAIKNEKIYEDAFKSYKLTIEEKQRILTNSIFGVDIDSQAVEVTKLSLYLKLLENEGKEAEGWLFKYTDKTLLPSLEDNIKCGNSLIGTDFYAQPELNLTDDDRIKVNCFDWGKGFAEIFKNGGFDVVIGNPPWGAEFNKLEKEYLCTKYEDIPSKVKDSYLYFIVKSFQLIKSNGNIGFITPNTWLLINNTELFRKKMLSQNIISIVDYGDGVFGDATVESSVFVINNSIKTNEVRAIKYLKGEVVSDIIVDKNDWLNNEQSRIILNLNKSVINIIKTIKRKTTEFQKCCSIIWGIKPYQVGYGDPPQTQKMVNNRVYHSDMKEGKEWKPLLVGKNINRYFLSRNEQFIKYGKWLMYPSNEKIMLQDKIFIRQTSSDIKATLDTEKYYCQNSVFIVFSESINLKFLLGILNSKVIDFVYKLNNPQMGKTFAEIKPSVIKQLPIPILDLSIKADKTRNDNLVLLVDKMLELKKKEAAEPNQQLKTMIARQIEAVDKAIDTAVYGLYNLSEDEVKVVEGVG